MTQKSYRSDVVLGDEYRDTQTGYVGIATSITFFQYACERICLETYDDTRREVKEQVFDAPRLVSTRTGERAEVTQTGGPGEPNRQWSPWAR